MSRFKTSTCVPLKRFRNFQFPMPRPLQKPRLSDLEREFLPALPRGQIQKSFMDSGQDYGQTRQELRKIVQKVQADKSKPIIVKSSNNGKMAEFRKEIAELYKLKSTMDYTGRQSQQKKIDEKVKRWNETNSPSGYHDLHGMGRDGALEYAKEVVRRSRKGVGAEVKFETGRGNHSVNNFPAIKVALMRHFEAEDGVKVGLEKGNDGVLVVRVE